MLEDGSKDAKKKAEEVLKRVRNAVGINYFDR